MALQKCVAFAKEKEKAHGQPIGLDPAPVQLHARGKPLNTPPKNQTAQGKAAVLWLPGRRRIWFWPANRTVYGSQEKQ
jgi:hypothetical protein